MVAGWTVILTALVYLSLLFAIAHFGDTWGRTLITGKARAMVYALALAVFCSSWTFYGSVGVASVAGLDFLAIYIGPILLFVFGGGFLKRIIHLSKSQNITSIADFVASRYGKSQQVAGLVCLIAVVGTIPYVALQLKAIVSSLTIVFDALEQGDRTEPNLLFQNMSIFTALLLAGFAAAFGTRHVETTEHQNGLMLAVAAESIVKLLCFLVVGTYITFVMFDGPSEIISRIVQRENLIPFFDRGGSSLTFAISALLSGFAVILLPRQFHVSVVENRDENDIGLALKLFPFYLIVINLFVIPIALSADLILPYGANRDMAVLEIPLMGRNSLIVLITFVGGLSAATAMVIVEGVALAIMISNDLVIPVLLRRDRSARYDMGTVVLVIRRIAILTIMLMGHLYYRYANDTGLASIGMISFAAIAQIGPVFLGGMIWRRGTALGASAGLGVGLLAWMLTLFLPSILTHESFYLAEFNHALQDVLVRLEVFGAKPDRLVTGTLFSLTLNTLAYVLFSLKRPTTPMERLQANLFISSDRPAMAQAFRLWRVSITMGELHTTVSRYLGQERTSETFQNFLNRRGQVFDATQEADIHLMRFAEHQLSSAIGASSSRLVLSLLMRRREVNKKTALRLLDDASAAIQYNRDLLQHALDHARQGITVFDRNLHLMCWNREFQSLFELTNEQCYSGVGLDEIIRHNAMRGLYGNGTPDDYIAARLESFVGDSEPVRVRLFPSEKVVEIRTAHMPDGGIVTTYTDITDTVEAEESLERANENLERRVTERTEELTRLNSELVRAKSEADEANTSKTRFLAAASHDILQPLNAARLYTTTLVERDRAFANPKLAENIDSALEAVEDILGALLDISRLDAGAMKPEFSTFRIDDILGPLSMEFEPLARSKGLKLRFVTSSLTIRSDRRLLRRLLQNLVSNAIKYTPEGKTPAGTILVGCRRRGKTVVAQVYDTGIGIPLSKQKIIFHEFQRLDQGARAARGLGLGLSIVERIARVLNHKIAVRSTAGRGSMFSVDMPMGPDRVPAATQTAQIPNPAAAPLKGMVLLCIDNEPAILDGMRMLLSGWGCQVITAPSLTGAFESLKPAADAPFKKPDIIIADYHLDRGTGIEAIIALRWKLGQDIPAILLTADRSPGVRDEAGDKQIHVMNKPLKPAALRSFLAQTRASLPSE